MWQGFKSEQKKKNPYQYPKHRTTSQDKTKKSQPIIFMVVDDQHMGMHLPYSLSNDSVKSLIKQNGGGWCHTFKIWKIPKETYTLIRTQIPRMLPQTHIEDLPLFIDRAMKPFTEKLHIFSANKYIIYDARDRHFNLENNYLNNKLYDYQKQSVKLAIKNYGRLIIGDEMGVGKSLQGLACALIYEKQWPLLIICPSSLKFVWKDEIKKWLRQKLKEQQVKIIQKNGQEFDEKLHKIVIYSYQLSIKVLDQLDRFNVVIADQAHYLKNIIAKRTELLVPYLTTRKRVFLLTGTPALSKPRQTFTLIQIIRPDIFHNLKQFGDRYCYLSKNPWNFKAEYDGCRNTAQLHYLLKNRIMIRRKKDQVLHQLPQKQRQFIILPETSKTHTKQIKQMLSSYQIPLETLRNSQKLLSTPPSQNSPLPQCYHLTGLAKLQSVLLYLTTLLQNSNTKILVFAHHKQILQTICEHLLKLKVEHMKIDGNTSMQTRKKNVRIYQDNYLMRVAVLSITAASVGITLTAASTVVFAELYWTPAVMLQAEDRAHRIGQRSCVNVHYLIGENTIDSLLLRQLQKKLETTGILLNGNKQFLQAETMQKGQLGKWQQSPLDLTQRKKNSQKNIFDYISIKRTDLNSTNEKQVSKHSQQSQDIDQDEDYIDEEQLQKLIRQKQLEFEYRQKLAKEKEKQLKQLSRVMKQK